MVSLGKGLSKLMGEIYFSIYVAVVGVKDWVSLSNTGWPQMHSDASALCLLHTRIKDMCNHTRLK